MSKLMDERVSEELRSILSKLTSPVRVLLFIQTTSSCPTCIHQQELLTELGSLSDKLKLEVYDMILNGDQALSYHIERTPATVVLGERDYGIRFYGLTLGHEFTSLLEALLMASSGQSRLDPELEHLVKGLSEKIHLQILVTLTCPYCPRMVHLAQQFALSNPNIKADMVEVGEYPELALRYNVTGVPKTIINEAHSFEGAVTAWALYLEILKAVNPGEYKRLEEQIHEAQENRRVRKIEEDHDYDVIVVGAGPAAMSAATYAARKGLDVALIGKLLGGQVNYTASVENYLGIPAISGADLTESFRTHLESMPVALDTGLTVTLVQKQDHHFLVSAEGNHRFKALALIYCAGKEYRRLGVPGEEQFIGKGIGFCATCDAPLYRGKRVAIVGGGNSAFTAARDLIAFATEIHLVHRRKEFRADPTLVEEVQAAKNVVFHTPVEVKAFLGSDRLTGITIESIDGKERSDLVVDGVFLELGLTPNSAPLRDLTNLNRFNEVPVNRDQSTSIPGLFAAGDVTDVEEKQISIAVGDGAKAALSAYRYLVENKLIQIKSAVKESWE